MNLTSNSAARVCLRSCLQPRPCPVLNLANFSPNLLRPSQSCSGPLDRYLELKQHQRDSYIHYFYETTVGAGEAQLLWLAACGGKATSIHYLV